MFMCSQVHGMRWGGKISVPGADGNDTTVSTNTGLDGNDIPSLPDNSSELLCSFNLTIPGIVNVTVPFYCNSKVQESSININVPCYDNSSTVNITFASNSFPIPCDIPVNINCTGENCIF